MQEIFLKSKTFWKNYFKKTITKIKNNIARLEAKDDLELITQWYSTVITDAKTILKNRYLVIETFMRLSNVFQKFYQ